MHVLVYRSDGTYSFACGAPMDEMQMDGATIVFATSSHGQARLLMTDAPVDCFICLGADP